MTNSVITRKPRLMRLAQKHFEIGQRAVDGIDVEIVGDIVTIIAEWGRIERQTARGP